MKIKKRRPHDDDQPAGYMESDKDYILNNYRAAVILLDNGKAIIDLIEDIESEVRTCEFFACNGPDTNRIETMKTCSHCALIIRSRRLLKKIKKET